MFCPNCGCMTLGKDCEWCGPAEAYKGHEKFCVDCGGLKAQTSEPSDKGDCRFKQVEKVIERSDDGD